MAAAAPKCCPECSTFVQAAKSLETCTECGLGRTLAPTTSIDRQDYLSVPVRERNLRKSYFQRLTRNYLGGLDAGRSLDVGCATGEFVDVLAAQGWDACGIDAFAEFRDDGERLFRSTLAEFESSNHFDLVTLVHCLEHMPDPIDGLRKVRRLLAPGGLALVVVPNFGGLWAKKLGERWYMLDLQNHVYHYTLTALENVIGRCGFDIVRLDTYAGHAVMPVEFKLNETGFFERGIGRYRPVGSAVSRGLAAARPILSWWIDKRRRGDEIIALASAA